MTQRIIGCGWYARSGKDTLADFLVEEEGAKKWSFTQDGGLNDILYAIDPWVEKPNSLKWAHLRDVIDMHGWEYAKDNYPQTREYQQALGQRAREVLGENVWIDSLFRKIKEYGAELNVITNVRHPNEAAAVQAADGFLIEVLRPGHGPVNDHISDNALANYDGWDITINNNGTLDQFRTIVQWVYEDLGQMPKGSEYFATLQEQVL